MTCRAPLTTCLILLVGLLPVALHGQQEPRGEFDDTVEVTEVLLDALVTDGQGNSIVGLGTEDFEVTENGLEMELLSATFYSNRAPAEGSGLAAEVGADSAGDPRYFVIFFHDLRRSTPELTRRQLTAAREAADWARVSLAPNDWVAVANYNASLFLHQDFTRDVGAILAGIDEASRGNRKQSTTRRRAAGRSSGEPSIGAGLPEGKELVRKTGTVYDGIRQLTEAMSHIQARKNLLMFTTGIGELQNGIWVPDVRYYPPMMKTLNANNVAVYTLDLIPVGVQHALSNSLSKLATDTNGEYYDNVANFTGPLKKIGNENSGYYLLSYRAPHPKGEADYQTVKVRTVNRNFDVRARRGYLYGY